jgi:hypothetical protein
VVAGTLEYAAEPGTGSGFRRADLATPAAQVSVLLRTRAKPLALDTLLTDDQLDALPPELSDLVGIGVPRPRVLAVPRKPPPMTSI